MTTGMIHELRVAEEIVSVLPAGSAMRVCSNERDTLRYAIRANGLKLQDVIFNRDSLQRLAVDPARDVKIEYLQRDLLRSAKRRSEFRYPRACHLMPRLPKRGQEAAAAMVNALNLAAIASVS